MAEFTILEARAAGMNAGSYAAGGAAGALRKAATSVGQFDIFLSHSFHDANVVLGVKTLLERSGKSVYVDWIDDPQLDRSKVSKLTAMKLRLRMDECHSMVYAVTPTAPNSKWMPWELGYFDGKKGSEAVAVMRLVDYADQPFGQEYLEIYPRIERSSLASGAPIVTERWNGLAIRTKSLDDLVAARGGRAWRSGF